MKKGKIEKGVYGAIYTGKSKLGYENRHYYRISIEKHGLMYIVKSFHEYTQKLKYLGINDLKNNWCITDK